VRAQDAATKAALRSLALAYEVSQIPYPTRLKGAEEKLGCTCLSLGSQGTSDRFDVNTASSIGRAFESAMRFFEFSKNPPSSANELGEAFSVAEAEVAGVNTISSTKGRKSQSLITNSPETSRYNGSSAFLKRFLFRLAHLFTPLVKKSSVEQHVLSKYLSVSDFDLLRVIGKGAFGRVLLVRKKHGHDSSRVFAMKVLKKSVVAAKGQIEHTRSERSILCEIRHPFIVRLRYAFQSDVNLYLVTDYYTGGSLFCHLQKSHGFSEIRARFYAVKCPLHLLHQFIFYRQN